jgi:hypothetical protein
LHEIAALGPLAIAGPGQRCGKESAAIDEAIRSLEYADALPRNGPVIYAPEAERVDSFQISIVVSGRGDRSDGFLSSSSR